MRNHREWIERAVAFAEQVRTFPGRVHVTVKVEPPLKEAELASLETRWRRPIPSPIRRFLTQGSADCFCYYYWDPPPPYPDELGKVVSHYLVGGADLCGAHGFQPPGASLGSVSLDYMLTGLRDMADGFQERGIMRESELWRHSFPFCHVGNGDYLALHVENDRRPDDYLVVYLDHDADPKHDVHSFFVDDSFDRFLSHWEELFYINPLFLIRFVDEKTGKLDPSLPKARQFQEIMRGFLAGV
jgi:hypothetical protein